MNKNTKIRPKGNGQTPSNRKVWPESIIRQRIRGVIEAGGILPVSPTGEKNLAGLFGLTVERVKSIISEESHKIGREVVNA